MKDQKIFDVLNFLRIALNKINKNTIVRQTSIHSTIIPDVEKLLVSLDPNSFNLS